MNTSRKLCENIKELKTAKLDIGLSENQKFYETNKAYEIWETKNDLLIFIKRISKSSVYWVCE